MPELNHLYASDNFGYDAGDALAQAAARRGMSLGDPPDDSEDDEDE